MEKNSLQASRRVQFIKLAINDSEAASSLMRKYARKLEQARNTTQRVQILTEILFISETTIFRELKKD